MTKMMRHMPHSGSGHRWIGFDLMVLGFLKLFVIKARLA